MRVTKDPDVRKQEILDGALKVFAEKGYDKTTISDIAKELGISQGLCYRYYASKEEIYDAALDEYAELIMERNIERFDNLSGNSFAEKIRNIKAEDYLQSEKGNPLLYELFHGENRRKMHAQLMLKVAEKLIPKVAEYLEYAKEKGEIHVENVQGLAAFWVCGQIGILMTEKDHSEWEKQIKECAGKLFGLGEKL